MVRIIVALFVVLTVLFSSTLASNLVCDRPNEVYRCGSACQTTCANLGKRCPIVNVRCNDACYCKDGYARNDWGMCIPIRDCDKLPYAASKQRRIPFSYN